MKQFFLAIGVFICYIAALVVIAAVTVVLIKLVIAYGVAKAVPLVLVGLLLFWQCWKIAGEHLHDSNKL